MFISNDMYTFKIRISQINILGSALSVVTTHFCHFKAKPFIDNV